MAQFRMTSGAIAQVLMSYEIGPSGFGTRRNNQYQIVGTEGSIFWDLDRLDLVTGDRDVQTWELPELDAPRLQATRPAPGRQHRPPARRLHRVGPGRRAAGDHRRGRPGRDRDDPGRQAVRPDRARRRPAAGRAWARPRDEDHRCPDDAPARPRSARGRRPRAVAGTCSSSGSTPTPASTASARPATSSATAQAIAYAREWLIGRDPLAIRPFVRAMLSGGLPPYEPQMSPTATVDGPAAWAVSGVEMALCDLAGKILGHAGLQPARRRVPRQDPGLPRSQRRRRPERPRRVAGARRAGHRRRLPRLQVRCRVDRARGEPRPLEPPDAERPGAADRTSASRSSARSPGRTPRSPSTATSASTSRPPSASRGRSSRSISSGSRTRSRSSTSTRRSASATRARSRSAPARCWWPTSSAR